MTAPGITALPRLNIGCGRSHLAGWINIDRVPPADLVHDVRTGLPYADRSVTAVRADNFVEHLTPDEYIAFLGEVHRVLVTGGSFYVIVPDAIAWPEGAFRDPTHRMHFVRRSFDYLLHNSHLWQLYGSSYGIPPWTGTVAAHDGMLHADLVPVHSPSPTIT